MLADGAELWHKGTMETGLDLDQASRETLLVIIAEQQGVISELRQRVESLEARLSGGVADRGPGCRATNLPQGARRGRGKQRSPAGSVNRALRGCEWNPPRK